jgi:hypothetical protein
MLLDGGVGIQKRSAGDSGNPDFPFVAGRSLKGKSRQRAWRSISSASLGAELCQMKPRTHDNNFCSHNYKCFATRSRHNHTQNVVAQLRKFLLGLSGSDATGGGRARPAFSAPEMLELITIGGKARQIIVRNIGNTDNPRGRPILPRLKRPAICLRPRAKARSSRFCRLAPSALPATGPCPGRDFWLGRKALNY